MARKTTKARSRKSATKASSAKVLKSRVVYRGPVFHVTTEIVREPSGVTARRDVVRHTGSVVIMAVDDGSAEPRLLLVRQFRHAAGSELWELPAGRAEKGENLLAAGKRELLEETGVTARSWKRALFFYVSPGFLDETMTLFLARGLRQGQANPDEDEVIETRFFPLSEAVRMAISGRIKDAKTLTGVLWLNELYTDKCKE